MNNTPLLILAGNPNVGKSTLFNYLTGMHQHTGNWTGKTVAGAVGTCVRAEHPLQIADVPGTYSLSSHSPEEQIARDFIAFTPNEGILVVCDSTCPQRGLVLALQIMEMTDKVTLCLNLTDQAEKKGVAIDENSLSNLLGIPVIKTSSKSKKSLQRLVKQLEQPITGNPRRITYSPAVERELTQLEAQITPVNPTALSSRFLAIKQLEQDTDFLASCKEHTGLDLAQIPIDHTLQALEMQGFTREKIEKEFLFKKYEKAEALCSQAVTTAASPEKIGQADRLLTGRWTSLPILLLGLLAVFWITIYGAQYPSELLWNALFSLEQPLFHLLTALHLPDTLINLVVYGVYRVVAWVVSVMLPPMAIFFPLFTLLEDIGILPRIALNLDCAFQKCRSCGKQALTMCMGFGCNAAGVTGCRIIRSRRERLIAILTNALVPCNGRFPTLITMLTLFFAVSLGGALASLVTAAQLTTVILLGVGMTFLCSYLLSKTVLKGEPSFYSLELPPYRIPKVGQVLVRSVLDRTVFVLLRSLAVAAPAGILIWLLANLTIGDLPLLQHCADFLDPLGNLIGLDGVILLAFILGIPANEIVVPIMLMTYSGAGVLTDYASLESLKTLLLQNGWSAQTALCMILFMLFHWPCATTLITVYKETKSIPYTLLAFGLPTLVGMLMCMSVHLILW